MSRRNRSVFLLLGLAVFAAAFVIMRPSDDDEPPAAASGPAVSTGPASTAGSEGATTTLARPRPAPPKVTRVKVVGLQPVGGVKKMKVEKGDTVRFTVSSDQPETVHVHGYDFEKPVAAGKPAKFVFKATIEGIFEVELEHSAVPIMELTVEP